MKQVRDKEKQETNNGYAHDIGYKAEAKIKEMANMASMSNSEVKGLAVLAGGLLLLAHTLGYLALLNWLLMAVAVAAIVWGATTSNVWHRIKQAAEYIKHSLSSKSESKSEAKK